MSARPDWISVSARPDWISAAAWYAAEDAEQGRLVACIGAIGRHSDTLRRAVKSDLWARVAREHEARAMRAVEALDWVEARDALDSACDMIVGGFGLNPLPESIDGWLRAVEAATA